MIKKILRILGRFGAFYPDFASNVCGIAIDMPVEKESDSVYLQSTASRQMAGGVHQDIQHSTLRMCVRKRYESRPEPIFG